MENQATNMPVILKDFRQTKVIELPGYKGSEVEIYDSLLLLDMVGYNTDEKKFIETMVNSLPKFIKSWNFTDEAGNPLPITRENLNFLSGTDAQYLMEQITEFNAQVKKNKQE